MFFEDIAQLSTDESLQRPLASINHFLTTQYQSHQEPLQAEY